MRLSSLWVCLAGLAFANAAALHFPGSVEHKGWAEKDRLSQSLERRASDGEVERQRADAVKEAFTFAWDGYWKYCKGQDELLPTTNTCNNPRNHWGASAVDGLSTALVMEIQPIVNDILDYIPTIDYTTSSYEVSLFETTIRYLAGMLAGYDLLKGPLSNLAKNETAVDTLLTQAKSLADTLTYTFDTPTGIPSNNLFLLNKSNDHASSNGLATIGSLVLEWQHLSDLTGDATYGKLAQKGESYLLNPQPAHNVPFPGLLGSNVDIATGNFLDANGGWNGGDDSFYEYLIKMYVYDSSKYGNYRDRWVLAADSTMKYLASNPVSRPDLVFLASYDNKTLVNASQHLTCFDGGNFLLGGQVLGRQDYIDFGLALVNGCHDTYISTATGIGPESFSWNSTNKLGSSDQAFFDKNGFYITNPSYDLRPEVIESFYYAYRITGNTIYQDWAWDAFVAINATCRTGSGFSSIQNINEVGGDGFANEQESFLFAEVMKYSYLIHAPDSIFQVGKGKGENHFVFNTEAHPFTVAGPPV